MLAVEAEGRDIGARRVALQELGDEVEVIVAALTRHREGAVLQFRKLDEAARVLAEDRENHAEKVIERQQIHLAEVVALAVFVINLLCVLKQRGGVALLPIFFCEGEHRVEVEGLDGERLVVQLAADIVVVVLIAGKAVRELDGVLGILVVREVVDRAGGKPSVGERGAVGIRAAPPSEDRRRRADMRVNLAGRSEARLNPRPGAVDQLPARDFAVLLVPVHHHEGGVTGLPDVHRGATDAVVAVLAEIRLLHADTALGEQHPHRGVTLCAPVDGHPLHQVIGNAIGSLILFARFFVRKEPVGGVVVAQRVADPVGVVLLLRVCLALFGEPAIRPLDIVIAHAGIDHMTKERCLELLEKRLQLPLEEKLLQHLVAGDRFADVGAFRVEQVERRALIVPVEDKEARALAVDEGDGDHHPGVKRTMIFVVQILFVRFVQFRENIYRVRVAAPRRSAEDKLLEEFVFVLQEDGLHEIADLLPRLLVIGGRQPDHVLRHRVLAEARNEVALKDGEFELLRILFG